MRLALLILLACLALPSTAGAALQAQYHLDVRSANSDSGSFTDDSGPNGLTLRSVENGTIIGAGGKFGNHLTESNGVAPSIVDEGNSAPLDAQRVTLLAWVRKLSGQPAAGQFIAGRGFEEATCGTHSYVLETASGGARFSIRQLGDKVSSPVSNAAFDGNWHLLTGTFDGTRVRLYVDGTQVGSGTPTSSTAITYNNESGFGIDGYAGGFSLDCPGQDFTGGVDELRVYDQALSSTEIGRLASAPTGGSPPVLVPDSNVGVPPRPAPPSAKPTTSCPAGTSPGVSCQASGGKTTIKGTAGKDTIVCPGAKGQAVCSGGGGNDKLDCSGGLARCKGGKGNDRISCSGGKRQAVCTGDSGNDKLSCKKSQATCKGGAGKDGVICSDGRRQAVCTGDSGKDKLTCVKSQATCKGGSGDDRITCSGGKRGAVCTGDSGDDKLRCSGGLAKCKGGKGDDLVDGRRG